MSDSVGKKNINLTLNGEKEYKNSAFPFFFPDFIIYFVNFSSEAEALVKV